LEPQADNMNTLKATISSSTGVLLLLFLLAIVATVCTHRTRLNEAGWRSSSRGMD